MNALYGMYDLDLGSSIKACLCGMLGQGVKSVTSFSIYGSV